jgi:hypothetical protein
MCHCMTRAMCCFLFVAVAGCGTDDAEKKGKKGSGQTFKTFKEALVGTWEGTNETGIHNVEFRQNGELISTFRSLKGVQLEQKKHRWQLVKEYPDQLEIELTSEHIKSPFPIRAHLLFEDTTSFSCREGIFLSGMVYQRQ